MINLTPFWYLLAPALPAVLGWVTHIGTENSHRAIFAYTSGLTMACFLALAINENDLSSILLFGGQAKIPYVYFVLVHGTLVAIAACLVAQAFTINKSFLRRSITGIIVVLAIVATLHSLFAPQYYDTRPLDHVANIGVLP